MVESQLTVDPEVAQFLERKDVKNQLLHTMTRRGMQALYTVSESTVRVTSTGQSSADQAGSFLKAQVGQFSLPLESEQESLLCCREWDVFLQALGFTAAKAHAGNVDVLTLKGMEEEKQTAILQFLTTPIERETLLPMEPGMLKYIQTHCHQLLADMDQVSIFPLEAEDNCGLKVPVACQMAEEVLQGVVSSVCTRTITVNVPGVVRFLEEKECQSILNEMERKFLVYISLKYVPWEPSPHQVMQPFSHLPPLKLLFPAFSSCCSKLPLNEPGTLTAQDADAADRNVPSGLLATPQGVLGISSLEEEAQLSLAIQYSMESSQWSLQDEEEQLKKALELSKLIQAEHASSASDNSQRLPQQKESVDLSFEKALKAANTLQLHVFAGYNCDLIRVDIAFNKKVNQRQAEEKVEHRKEEYSLLSHLPDATKIDEESEEFQEVVKTFYSTIQEYHSKIRIIQVRREDNPHAASERAVSVVTASRACCSTPLSRWSKASVGRTVRVRKSTVYGQGVYFAVNSALSVQDQYSPPNADGYKFIFVSKVLTGDFTKGNHSMKTAPLKETGDIPLRYESVTDDITKPSMFVIFNDTQAFPEYLITCQRIHPFTPGEP
uniref:Poly [ADP-ribose] polymerase n=1 Tax=Fundulus heteroclitus TaxID=8078 RepID=A0A3Q2UJS5_FUNHE